MKSERPKYIVGIGASAGGLKAYIDLLGSLPDTTGMAFVIIAHMSPTKDSMLVEILARKTKMGVLQATNGMEILANQVYVIPPNANLLIDDFFFRVITPRTMFKGRHKQVDFFLESLADLMGPQAISIILSGGDSDGSLGSKHIKDKGGITFAQDLSAEVDSMPLSALATGCIDYVLSPTAISEQLVAIANSAHLRQKLPIEGIESSY